LYKCYNPLGHLPHNNREGSSPVDILEEFGKKKPLIAKEITLKVLLFFKEIERLFIY